jgi:hypothetical protein
MNISFYGFTKLMRDFGGDSSSVHMNRSSLDGMVFPLMTIYLAE